MASIIIAFLFATFLGALGFLFKERHFEKKRVVFWIWLVLLCGTIGFGIYSIMKQNSDSGDASKITNETIINSAEEIKTKMDSVNPNAKLFPLNLCTFQDRPNPILLKSSSKDSVILQIGICNRLSRGISNMSDKTSLIIFKADTVLVSEDSHPSAINRAMTFYPGDNFQINISLKKEEHKQNGCRAYCCYWIKENDEKKFIVAVNITNMTLNIPMGTASQSDYELIVSCLDKANLW